MSVAKRGEAPPALAVPSGRRLDAVLACDVGVAPPPPNVHRPSVTDVRETLNKLFGEVTPDMIERYILKNIARFDPKALIVPGTRVLERDSGRVGTVQDYEHWHSTRGGGDHPAVIYDDDEGNVSTEYGKLHFIVIKKDGEELTP